MWNGKYKYNLLVCQNCKKEFKSPLFQRDRKFCSHECFCKSEIGRQNYWNSGKKLSNETKKKISIALSGKKFTKEHKRKLSIIAKNRKFSDDRRKKLSVALKNRWKTERDKFVRYADKNGNWKGGITPEIISARSSVNFINWRKSVFARDNWTCQKCGDNKGGNLEAHHIKLFSECFQERFLIENGITLCEICHQKIHKGKRTKENPLSKI